MFFSSVDVERVSLHGRSVQFLEIKLSPMVYLVPFDE